jgi:L-ascorbate metabolism protein UlaG (beta-lactamase superfamily)
MKITKFEHACFTVEENDQSLIVDPGGYTTDLAIPKNVVGIIITHEHRDHFNKELLQKIVAENPNAIIYTNQNIVSQLAGFTTQTVTANEGIKIGDFHVEFFGGHHAMIFAGKEEVINLGVMINGHLYYPGDSFYVPDVEVKVLALPVSAPWLKISEVIDFLTSVKPQLAFPTHDAILSDIGKALPDRILPPIAEKVGTKYQRLVEPLEI